MSKLPAENLRRVKEAIRAASRERNAVDMLNVSRDAFFRVCVTISEEREDGNEHAIREMWESARTKGPIVACLSRRFDVTHGGCIPNGIYMYTLSVHGWEDMPRHIEVPISAYQYGTEDAETGHEARCDFTCKSFFPCTFEHNTCLDKGSMEKLLTYALCATLGTLERSDATWMDVGGIQYLVDPDTDPLLDPLRVALYAARIAEERFMASAELTARTKEMLDFARQESVNLPIEMPDLAGVNRLVATSKEIIYEESGCEDVGWYLWTFRFRREGDEADRVLACRVHSSEDGTFADDVEYDKSMGDPLFEFLAALLASDGAIADMHCETCLTLSAHGECLLADVME